MPAKLPSELIEPPDRPLSDLKIGESSYLIRHGMRVDADGFCYLDPRAKLYQDDCPLFIEVTRAIDGFRVRIARRNLTWKLGKLSDNEWYPVEAITITC